MENFEFHSAMGGLLIMGAGILLLFHTLGIMEQAFTFLLVGASAYLIVYGFYRAGLYDLLKGMMAKKK